MSTRANPMVIGAFVVGAAALLMVALLVWGGTGLFRTRLDYVLFFDAAVTGLNKGAPVLARGVKVGEVTDVQLRWGTPVIAVYIALEPQALKGTAEAGPARAIERAVREDGLRAQLRMQSFVTGVLYVALDVRPDTPIVLRGLDPRVPELPTIPTDLEVWTAKLERFAATIEKVPLEQMAQTTAAVLEDVKKIVESKETRCSHSSRVLSRASTPLLTRPRSWSSTWTAASTRLPPRPRRRSRRRRRPSATPGRSSRTCVASWPGSMPKPIRC